MHSERTRAIQKNSKHIVGLSRFVALHYRSSALHQIRYENRCFYYGLFLMRPGLQVILATNIAESSVTIR